jgi:Fic family protein
MRFFTYFVYQEMELQALISEYRRLPLKEVLDHEKFNLISIDHHSTRIEGSTLTEVEAQVLITEGKTPKGKPLEESLMVTDHHKALLFVLGCAKEKRTLDVAFIQAINAHVMQSTGKVYHTMLGAVDSRSGAFRKGNVTAGVSYFPNFDKVERLTHDLATKLNQSLTKPLSEQEQINLSFDAHFSLVSIHPFYDGNGRTSRLLMNYIQAYFDLPLAIVYSQNKVEYIQALIESREKEDIGVFRAFMSGEYAALLKGEIDRYREMERSSGKNGFQFLF